MVDKAKLQAYIATLPKNERAKFQRLPVQQQISIMDKALRDKAVQNNDFSAFNLGSSISIFGNDRYACRSDNTRVNTGQLQATKVKVQAQQAEKAHVASLPKENLSAESRKLRQDVLNRMTRSYESANASFNAQRKKDGWAGDVADTLATLWNNDLWKTTGNTSTFVRSDLAHYRENIDRLRRYAGTAEFKTQFQKIFHVPYNETNIKNFNNAEARLKKIAESVTSARAIQTALSGPLKDYQENFGMYKDKVENFVSPTGNRQKVTPKAQLLTSIRTKVEEVVGKKYVDVIAKQSNVDLTKLNEEQQYNFYIKLAQQLVEGAKNSEKKALNGKSFEYYEKQYDAAYAKAYGTTNNIQRRIAKYNTSQEVGAAAVKSGTQAIIVVGSSVLITASGGTATPLVVAGISAGTSAVIDITDKATNGIDGDVVSSLPSTLKSAVIDGAFTYAGGNVAKVLTSSVSTTTKVGEVAVKAAANGIGATAEGTARDIVSGGLNNVSIKTVAIRAAVASTLGNLKLVTDNSAVLNTVGVGKSMTTSSLLKSVRISLKEQAEKSTEAKQIVKFMEDNPEEFDNIVIQMAKERVLEEETPQTVNPNSPTQLPQQ